MQRPVSCSAQWGHTLQSWKQSFMWNSITGGFYFQVFEGVLFCSFFGGGSHCFQHDDISMYNTCLICVLCRILFWLNSLLNSWLVIIETLFVIVQHLLGCSVCHCSKWKRQRHITKLALIKITFRKVTKLYFILFGKNWKTPLMSSVWSAYTLLWFVVFPSWTCSSLVEEVSSFSHLFGCTLGSMNTGALSCSAWLSYQPLLST